MNTKTRKSRAAKWLFWSWNIIFLAFMAFGFAPRLLPDLLTAVESQTLPVAFLGYAIVLTLIPIIVMAIGFFWLRHDAERLFTLGYGVEGPLMLLIAVRFFVVKQATTAVTLILLIGALGIAALLWQLLDKNIEKRHPVFTHLRLIGLTLLLGVGIYTAIWLTFYVVPAGYGIAEGIGRTFANFGEFLRNLGQAIVDLVTEQFVWIPFALLGIALFIYTATLFILMPIAVPVLYIRAWLRSLRDVASSYNRPWAVGLSTAVLIIAVALVITNNRQPQATAFALMEQPPASLDDAEALLAQENTIRAGLLNAYLAPQRYISAQGEVYHIRDIYEDVLHLSADQASSVQAAYEAVASPLIYKAVEPLDDTTRLSRWDNRVFQQEPVRAAEMYQQYFDQPILDGERDTIVAAARSTWSPDQALNNWQTVDDREVHLSRQEVTVIDNGDWAEIELYEAYQNQTAQRQEVVYYFSLPESAVLTGVWLGNSDNRANRFAFTVAPRGAAQTLYQQEVRRRVDPALLEQIGPSQYRLRIFPIEPQTWRYDEIENRTILEDAPPLHLWLTYRALPGPNGYPLPQLADLRNVYWDDNSVRLLNGAPLAADEATWLPPTAGAPGGMAQPHRVDFANGRSLIIRPADAADMPLPTGLHTAVVLDRSRSMVSLDDEIAAALAQIDEMSTAVDVYLTASPFRGQEPEMMPLADLNVADILYFGGQDAADLVAQFNQLSAGRQYDAIIVLTDDGTYGLSGASPTVVVPTAPLWMVHLGGGFPPGYDDATLAAIQASGGGVANNLDTALTRLALARTAASPADLDVVDGYVFAITPTADAPNEGVVIHAPTDPFAALAARRLIVAEMVRQQGQLHDLAVLDGLHALATDQGIVTPYSSMIVLVNRVQESRLEALSDNPDRFEREFEDIGETENVPITVTGVPEPEEWLLIGLALAMLVWFWRQQQHTPLSVGH